MAHILQGLNTEWVALRMVPEKFSSRTLFIASGQFCWQELHNKGPDYNSGVRSDLCHSGEKPNPPPQTDYRKPLKIPTVSLTAHLLQSYTFEFVAYIV